MEKEIVYVSVCLIHDLNERWIYGDINSAGADEHYHKHVVNTKEDYIYYVKEGDPHFLITAPSNIAPEKQEEFCKQEYLKRAEMLADTDARNLTSGDRNRPVVGITSEESGRENRYIKIRSSLDSFGGVRYQELVVYVRDKKTGEPLIISYMLCNKAKADKMLRIQHRELPPSELDVNVRTGKVFYKEQDENGNLIDVSKEFPKYSEAKRFFDNNKFVSKVQEIKWGEVTNEVSRNTDKVFDVKSTDDYHIKKIIKLSDNQLSKDEAEALLNIRGKSDLNKVSEIKYKNIVELYTLMLKDGVSLDNIRQEILKEHLFRVPKNYLTEANRQQLLNKSRNAQHYKNTSKGKNRYERRTRSSISATVRDYNKIDMDELFKRDILEVKIPVLGETDVYEVDIKINGLLSEVRKHLMQNKGLLEFKVILQSLIVVLNSGDVFIGCSCPDAKYRMAYNQTKNGYKAGYRETRPSNITNPNDTLGAGCKHVMLILSNLDWCVKVASVINNYIKYCKEHLQKNYADYIFPKVYGVKYDRAVQLDLFDTGIFPTDQKTINTVIGKQDNGMLQGRNAQGKFTKGNTIGPRFQPLNKPKESPSQTHLDLKFGKEPELVPEEEETNN